LNAAVPGRLRLSLALGLSSLPEAGSGEAETSVLGGGDLDRDDDTPESIPCPRASSGEVEFW
jgi:hypothetical protein